MNLLLSRSVRHIICLLEAPVTLKKLISVSLNVYLEVHHILCNSRSAFQRSVCCPCHFTVTRLILLTALIIRANLVSGLESRFVLFTYGANSTSVGRSYLTYHDADTSLHDFYEHYLPPPTRHTVLCRPCLTRLALTCFNTVDLH